MGRQSCSILCLKQVSPPDLGNSTGNPFIFYKSGFEFGILIVLVFSSVQNPSHFGTKEEEKNRFGIEYREGKEREGGKDSDQILDTTLTQILQNCCPIKLSVALIFRCERGCLILSFRERNYINYCSGFCLLHICEWLFTYVDLQ